MMKNSNVTSVLRHFRPSIDTSDLLQHQTYNDNWSLDIHYILIRPTCRNLKSSQYLQFYHKDHCSGCTQICKSDAHSFVGRMHNFRRSDSHFLYVGCTHFLGLKHNFCRSDAQLHVGCTTSCRMHTFFRSDAQICSSYEHSLRSDR